MQIIKFEPQAGDWFDKFIQTVITFTKEICNNKSIPLDRRYLSHLKSNVNTDWDYPTEKYDDYYLRLYNDVYSWTENVDIENFIIEFSFNSDEVFQVIVKDRIVQTTVEDLKTEYQARLDKSKQQREEWLLTSEGLEHTRKLQEEQTASQIKLDKWKVDLESYVIEFTETGEADWQKGLEVNQDGYGKGIYDYAKTWAYLMQQQMVDEILTKEIMDSTSHEADVEGITGFMHGAAVSILAQCWKYGNQIRKIHNADYGVESETSTVNPAMLTITV